MAAKEEAEYAAAEARWAAEDREWEQDLPRYFVSWEVVDHHVVLDHESRRIVVRPVESKLPMLVSAFEAPSLVESQAALQADYSGAPREGSLSSVSSVVPDSEVDSHRHHMHEPPS